MEKKVIIHDDEVEIREIFSLYLEDLGYVPVKVSDPEEVVSTVQKYKIEAVITDLNLAKKKTEKFKTGLELGIHLKNAGFKGKIIGFSEEVSAGSSSDIFDNVLAKPFMESDLRKIFPLVKGTTQSTKSALTKGLLRLGPQNL